MSGMSPQKMRFNVPATIGQAAAHEGPLRVVKSRHSPRLSGSPLYPQKRTSESLTVISPLGHFQTHASQQSKPYSITSSALASTDAGRSRPSALAVFRLTTSSCLVGVCTGRSAGFAPALISAILGHAGAAQRQRPPRSKLGRSCRAVLAGAFGLSQIGRQMAALLSFTFLDLKCGSASSRAVLRA